MPSLRRWGVPSLVLPFWSHSGDTQCAVSLRDQPMFADPASGHANLLTLITPRLAVLGHPFEIPDAEVWQRGMQTSPDLAGERSRLRDFSQPPRGTGREEDTDPPWDVLSARLFRFKLVPSTACLSRSRLMEHDRTTTCSSTFPAEGRLHGAIYMHPISRSEGCY
jgi:hypothetical protein